MPDDDPDKAAADNLIEFLLLHAKRFIFVNVVKGKPYKHPWIDEACRADFLKKSTTLLAHLLSVRPDTDARLAFENPSPDFSCP